MPISADCPQCGKTYQVKDDFAGKKFRCKACEGVVSVPAAGGGSSGDPWDDLDLNSFGDRERDEDGNEFEAPPAPRRRSKGKKKSRGGGMPVTVIVALVAESILLLLSGVLLIGSLVGFDICGAFIMFIRVALEGGAIFGYVKGVNVIRWISVALGTIGALTGLGCSAMMGFGGVALIQQADMDIPADQMAIIQGAIGIIIAVGIAWVVLYAVIISCLLTPSAGDHFNR